MRCEENVCEKKNQVYYDPEIKPDGVCVLGCRAGNMLWLNERVHFVAKIWFLSRLLL